MREYAINQMELVSGISVLTQAPVSNIQTPAAALAVGRVYGGQPSPVSAEKPFTLHIYTFLQSQIHSELLGHLLALALSAFLLAGFMFLPALHHFTLQVFQCSL